MYESHRPKFITDFGKPVFVSESSGRGRMDLGRYGVWATDDRGKDVVIATGNNLRKLKREYGKQLPVFPLPHPSKGGRRSTRRGQRTWEGAGLWDPDNTDRADWAAQAVETHATITGTLNQEDLETQVGDLLCNLCHLMGQNGIKVDELLKHGKECYEEELAEERWEKEEQRKEEEGSTNRRRRRARR